MKKRIVCLCLGVLLLASFTGCETKKDGTDKENNVAAETGNSVIISDQQSGDPLEGVTVELPPLDLGNPIKAKPSPATSTGVDIKDSFPVYKEDMSVGFQVDLRCSDLTRFDLSDKEKEILNADFDTKTIWPEKLPEGFDYNKIMELGKNPGLGMRKLHEKGITGKGVGIAVIDGELLVDHAEYKNNLKYYEEIGSAAPCASMHAAAVSSIAAGKNVGVAPDADLYYLCAPNGVFDGGFEYDFSFVAAAINRVLEINKQLPDENKIRVISISVGWDSSAKGYKKVMDAVDNAKKEGVFVVSSSLDLCYGYKFDGLGKDPLSDPDDINSYIPGLWLRKNYCNNPDNYNNSLFVPMDCRTTASQAGNEEYVYYCCGGWSWSIPYIAGTYALACQVKPDITYDEFWKAALETADSVKFKYKEKEYEIPKILNPQKLIDAVK